MKTAEQICDDIEHDGTRKYAIATIAAALEEAFKIGFEHAVAGGEDAASKMPQLRAKMPLVMYFDNEADRREMIDAVHLAKPGMVATKIPDRKR